MTDGRNSGITARRYEQLLLQAIKEEAPKWEGISWESIVGPSRQRECADARKRVTGLYYALSDLRYDSSLERLICRDRSTFYYIREQHATLMNDISYRRRYVRLLKEVQDRLTALVGAENNNLINPNEMFTSTICGTLGRDAEVVTLRDRNYYKLNAAISGRSKEAPTTWVQVLYYKSDGSRLGDMLKKGAGILAQGRTEVSTYAKRDGSQGVDITVWADTLEITKYAEGERAAQASAPADGNDLPF